MATDPIKKIILKDKSVRYRFVIDVGRRPDGKRDQKTFTFANKTEAIAERSKIIADRSRGTFVRPTRLTVAEHLDAWLAGKRKIQESTRGNYRNALIPVREQLGHLALQEVTKAHVDRLVNAMLASGRRVGTKGNPLSPSTVTLMLTCLRMAFNDALKQGILVRNVVALVDRPGVKSTEMSTWTAEQAVKFLAYVAEDRLAVAWQMSLFGLRRGEVLGLRWSDVNLVDGTITINKTRKIVERIVDGHTTRKVVEGEPKTERGKRTLPLDAATSDALTSLQLRQREERDAAGDA